MTTELNTDDIIEQLKAADDAYFNSDNVLMSDADYDNLRRTAHKLNPKHPYFVTVGSDVRGGKIKLPYPMNGLTQIDSPEDWIKEESYDDNEIIITDKLDGASGLLVFADKDGDGEAEFIVSYSRGNSLEGADTSRHMKHMNFPKKIPGYSLFVIRVENIVKEKVFQDNYKSKYSTARAMVAGCMNRSDTDHKILADISTVAYTIIATDKAPLNKMDSLAELRRLGFEIPFTTVAKGKTINNTRIADELKISKQTSPYELDGYVLSDNRSGRSVKFKIVDANSVVEPKVKSVHWEISKYGFQKPVVEIEPVVLYGTVVTFATGFNAKFIVDNCIGPGATVRITKSGSVIPYIMEVLAPAKSGMPQLPPGDNIWNKSGVDLMVKDLDSHPEVLFKLVLDFFETLKVDLLKEASMNAVFAKLKFAEACDTYDDIINILFDLTEAEWVGIIGANGKKIYESLHRRLNNMKEETLLGAVKYFGFGFGVRKARGLLNQISYDSLLKATEADLIALDGFDDTMASRIVAGMPAYKKFIEDNKDYITFIKETKTDEMKDISVVFTGFRDSELEEKVQKMGGKVSSGVSKKTTYLVSTDADSNSGKGKKAKELGVTILTVDQFKDKFNL